MIRSGRTRTKEQEAAASQAAQEKSADGDVGRPGESEREKAEDGGREPTLADLAGILRAHMGQQEARDEKQREMVARQEQRFKALQHQFQMLQLEVQARTSPLPTDSDPDLEAPSSRPHLQAQVESTFIADATTTATEVNPDESPKELYVRLKELYGKWIQPKGKTIHDVSEMIILEQYLRMVSPELQVWIKEHDPASAMEAARLADVFVAARKKGQPWSHNSWKTTRDSRKTIQQYYPKLEASGGKPLIGESQSMPKPQKPAGKKPICYLCGVEGHTKPMCPKNTARSHNMCVVPRPSVNSVHINEQDAKMIDVEVNGTVLKALIDTGSGQTLVHRKFVPPYIVSTNDAVPICCVHGDEKCYSTAEMYIRVEDQTYLLNVVVADNLPYPVVLGRDLPVLLDLLESDKNLKCCAAVTRGQVKKSNEHQEILSTLPFYNHELETKPGKSRKTRRQRRREKFLHTVLELPTNVEPESPLGFQIPVEIIDMQKGDNSLAPLFQKISEEEQGADPDGNKEAYILQKGILYRQQGSVLQLVVPQAARDIILQLGHAVPWAGHLGLSFAGNQEPENYAIPPAK
ncbi:uncharacterized protein LOC132888832 [Neoarius graeffei]|uniref:uncharacterized protein LOC132888832 n=1 Tax=Neoarius graeffei TaxID=443677 RepID=UPI00298CD814|nr:uncharacterized protein LOC132888832 [Neoarius graeffei]